MHRAALLTNDHEDLGIRIHDLNARRNFHTQ